MLNTKLQLLVGVMTCDVQPVSPARENDSVQLLTITLLGSLPGVALRSVTFAISARPSPSKSATNRLSIEVVSDAASGVQNEVAL